MHAHEEILHTIAEEEIDRRRCLGDVWEVPGRLREEEEERRGGGGCQRKLLMCKQSSKMNGERETGSKKRETG